MLILKQLSSLHWISVFIFNIFLSLSAFAGDRYHTSAGAAEAGRGNVCVMHPGFWSSFHNQALLAYNNDFAVSASYTDRFGIKELSTRSAAIIVPAGKLSIGCAGSYFGYTDFKRWSGGIACGMPLSQKIAAGIQVDYFTERTIRENNIIQFLTAEIGLAISASENVTIGIHLFNPVPNALRHDDLPSTLRVGIGSSVSKVLFAGTEVEMTSEQKMLLRAGFEYEAWKKVWLRAGYSTENNAFSFGIGFLLKPMKLDLSFTSHEKLGISPGISLIFKIG